MRPQFGVVLPNGFGESKIENLGRVALEAESLGYDTVITDDNLCFEGRPWSEVKTDDDITHYESLSLLSYLSAITKNIKLGVWAMVPPPRNVIVLAKQIATLDNLSRGRLQISFGIGTKDNFGPYAEGTYHVDFKRRARIVEDYSSALREIWKKGRTDFKGKYIDFERAAIFPRPVQQPFPIFMAARTEVALDRVAEFGDGWTSASETPAWISKHHEILKEKLQKYGKGKDLPIRHGLRAYVANDGKEAIAKCTDFIEHYRLAHKDTYNRPVPSFEHVLETCSIGSPDDVIKKLQQFIDAGVSQFYLAFPVSTELIMKNIGLFQEKVLPSF
jgi:alkanesulfonate monooxygenase SsuD/methylene tetrahydromethanopterin reductase-like flavin-dependent oxidoreductase (luciferase family)